MSDLKDTIVRMAKIGLTEHQMAAVLRVDVQEIFKRQKLIDDNLPKNFMFLRWKRVSKLGPELAKRFRVTYYELRSKDPVHLVKRAMWSQLYTRLHQGKNIKSKHAIAKLDYSFQELARHLEKQFKDGMSWENYGSWWVIDHKIPQSWFDIESVEDDSFLECWGLKNLQPMQKRENLVKNNKWAG